MDAADDAVSQSRLHRTAHGWVARGCCESITVTRRVAVNRSWSRTVRLTDVQHVYTVGQLRPPTVQPADGQHVYAVNNQDHAPRSRHTTVVDEVVSARLGSRKTLGLWQSLATSARRHAWGCRPWTAVVYKPPGLCSLCSPYPSRLGLSINLWASHPPAPS